jgi:hypothetical protein
VIGGGEPEALLWELAGKVCAKSCGGNNPERKRTEVEKGDGSNGLRSDVKV